MASPLDEALKRLRVNSTPNLNPTKVVDNPIGKALASPRVQTNLAKGFAGLTKGSERSGDIGFGGIFGDVIDIIDTPRSILASTAQEVVDVFQGEGFSPTDWWEQVEDNHLFGEVLRDSGVDLPGPLDFALGLGLDIAFDPLTYMAGAGVAARLAKADDVVVALRQGASAADKAAKGKKGVEAAELTAKATRMRDASEKVRKTRSVLSAGPALADIGIDTGARLTVPGTGRLGRNIIEKPLDALSGGRVSQKLNPRRVDQLKDAEFLFDEAGFVAKNAPDIEKAMGFMRRNDAATLAELNKLSPQVRNAATMASRMPVETKLRLPWSTPLVAAVAAVPGKVMRYATQRKLVETVDQAMNTRQPIRAMKIGTDPDLGLAAVHLERALNKGEVGARRLSSELLYDARNVISDAQKLDVPLEDLLRASDRPYFLDEAKTIVNPELPDSIKNLKEPEAFHDSLTGFWKKAETSFNEITGTDTLSEMVGDLYAARFLSEEGADVLGVANLNEFTPRGIGRLKARSYVSPSQYASYERRLGPERTAQRYSKTFLGEDLLDSDVAGKSVRDQMNDIGELVLKDEYKDLWSNDFVEVIPKYIKRLEQYARETIVTSDLQDLGILVRGGPKGSIQSSLTTRLNDILKLEDTTTKAVKRLRQKATVADARLATLPGRANAKANNINKLKTRLELQLDRLTRDVSHLVDDTMIDDLTVDIQKDLLSRSQKYGSKASEMGRELAQLNRLVQAIKAVGTTSAGTQNPALFAGLEKTINDLGNALTSFNKGHVSAMMKDETVVAAERLQNLLRGEVGRDPFSMKAIDPATKRFKTWEEIFSTVKTLDDELQVSRDLLLTEKRVIDDALRNARRELETLDIAKEADIGKKATGLEVGDLRNEKMVQLQRDAIEFQEQLLRENERLVDQRLAYYVRLHGESVQEGTRLKKFLEDLNTYEKQSVLASINEAKVSGQTGRMIAAAETQEEALKLLNNQRTFLGFNEMYNEVLSKQFLSGAFGDFKAVNADESVELVQAAMNATSRINSPKAMGEFGKKYSKLLNWWKAQAVASPGFILRNGMGGVWINSQIAGVEMGTHTKVVALARAAIKAGEGDLRAGVRALRDAGEPVQLSNVFDVKNVAGVDDVNTFAEMVESGIAQGGQAWSEVEDALFDLGLGGTWNPLDAQFKPFRGIRLMNEKMEFMLRGGLAFDAMANKGKSIDEAWDLVRKYHFDYSDLTNTERKIKMVIPFWKWQKSVMPVLVESIGKNPKAWGRLQQIKGELELGTDEETLVPDYFAKSLGIRLPFEWGGGRVYTLPDLPFKDLKRFTESPTAPFRGLAEGAVPFVKLAVEIWSGKQIFGDIPFSGRYQQAPNSYGKIPGLMPILGMMGKAKQNKQGEWKMRDRDIHLFDSFSPLLGRVRRLFPNEESKQRRVLTSWLSFLFGGGVRINDPQSKKSAWYRTQDQLNKDLQDMQDIEFREI